jgi:death-on-curing protein
MKEPIWIIEAAVHSIHDHQIAEYGGEPGIRDANLLGSALNAPKNHWHYESTTPDLFELGAMYLVRIAKNHPFIDGNKRTSVVVTETFLLRNGIVITGPDDNIFALIHGFVIGDVSQDNLANWYRGNHEQLRHS